MWFLYLDESGDLGFDFFGKRPSRFFTVAIMAVDGIEENRKIIKAVRKTIRRKFPIKRDVELKGVRTRIEIKQYFYSLIRPVRFSIYALTLNKRRVYDELATQKDRVYNFISRKVLDQFPFEDAETRIQLYLDRCKSKLEVREFNSYLERQLKSRIDPRVPLSIDHADSSDNPGLQVIDLFAWGIFRKYEKKDSEWFEVFKEKVRYDERYL
ncbi:MAG TPA: DUF3800 domain-containing protein [Nitrospiria bacterium]|jgi:hypothetical protein